jgi:hypothetical protein
MWCVFWTVGNVKLKAVLFEAILVSVPFLKIAGCEIYFDGFSPLGKSIQ